MKKPTVELWCRQKRVARYRFDERQRRRGKTHVPASHKFVRPGSLIKAPPAFNLTRGAGVTVVKFLRAVAHAVLVDGIPVRLDFKNTESFAVPGTILLFAELDRIVASSDLPKPITIIDPFRRRPREVLKQIGIHQLTGDRSDVIPERDDVVYWKATKGVNQTGDKLGSLVEVIAERANRDHARQLEVSGVWRSVSEAVANSVDHAYKKPRKDGFSGLPDTKWWMFSQIKDGVFTLAVCDLGCGYRETINETIPEQFISGIASMFAGSNRDALAIDTAMEYGRSGTNQNHRGKGSRDALSLLKKHGTGELVVMSGTGWMRYVFNNEQETDRNEGDLGIDIGGTIVWWKLPLKDVPNEDD